MGYPAKHPIYNSKHRAYPLWNRLRYCKLLTLHAEWKNFPVFAEWCESQIGWKHGFKFCCHIKPYSNEYSPMTCGFVPTELSVLLITGFEKSTGSNTGIQGSHRNSKGGYLAQLFGRTTTRIPRVFDTPEEAHEAYRFTKIKRIQFLADEWKWKLDYWVYDALKNYQLE